MTVVSIPSIGRGPSVMTEGGSEEEWRKRITAKLLLAPQFILIDNIRFGLDSERPPTPMGPHLDSPIEFQKMGL